MKDNVDAIAGLAKIAGFLREEDRDPNFEAYAGKSFGGTLELAVFGRVRNESDRRVELARHRLAQYAAPGGPVGGEGRVVDRLPADRARRIRSERFSIGTLVAIRPFGKKDWTLGVVRRLKRPTADAPKSASSGSRAKSPASTWSSSGAAPKPTIRSTAMAG